MLMSLVMKGREARREMYLRRFGVISLLELKPWCASCSCAAAANQSTARNAISMLAMDVVGPSELDFLRLPVSAAEPCDIGTSSSE